MFILTRNKRTALTFSRVSNAGRPTFVQVAYCNGVLIETIPRGIVKMRKPGYLDFIT